MELLVCILLAMNIFMAEELAESKGTTLIDLAVNPVKKFANKAINKAKDMAHKAATTVIDTKDKAVVAAKETVDKCEVAVNKAVSDMTDFAVTNLRVAEEMIMKQTTIYKEMKATNDSLMARIDKLEALLVNNNTNDDLLAQITELQAKLDDITNKYNALDNKKPVVNKPKRPTRVDEVNA